MDETRLREIEKRGEDVRSKYMPFRTGFQLSGESLDEIEACALDVPELVAEVRLTNISYEWSEAARLWLLEEVERISPKVREELRRRWEDASNADLKREAKAGHDPKSHYIAQPWRADADQD